jgi:DHA2 family multidrug resistance protein
LAALGARNHLTLSLARTQWQHSLRCPGGQLRETIKDNARQPLDPTTCHGAAMLDQMINHQAQIIAYVDDYKMVIFTTLPALLLLFLMRRPRQAPQRSAESTSAME